MKKIPECAQMKGAALYPSNQTAEGRVEISYIDHSNEWCSLKMPLMDALYLLNILDTMAHENGYTELRKHAKGVEH